MLLGRVVGQGEPLWLPADTQAVLELLRLRSLLCPGCGLPRQETMDPEAEGAFESTALRCHACATRDRKAREFERQKADSGGLYFTAERRHGRP